MSRQREKNTHNGNSVIVGLDLGTTKIEVIVAEIVNDELKIVGMGDSPSEGINNGVVANIELAVASIRKAVAQAEAMGGFDVKDIVVGVTGSHIRAMDSSAIVPISQNGREITQRDIDQSLEQAGVIQMPADYEIIHRIPMGYTVDGQSGITNPIGMSGVRLESKVCVVMASRSVLANIQKSVERAGFNVASLVLSPLAASEAVLINEQKELGVAVIDLGGGTTDVAVFSEGAIRHAASVNMGNIKVTDDLALALHTARTNAEKIKCQFGACQISRVEDVMVTIPGIANSPDREVPRSELVQIIKPRVAEILTLAFEEIKKKKMDTQLGAGIVLTGGGSQLAGIKELTEGLFKMPVQIGSPIGVGGIRSVVSDPAKSTGVGLVQYIHQQAKINGTSFLRETESSGIGKFFKAIWEFLRRFF